MAKLEPLMGVIVDQLRSRRAELDGVDDLVREREGIDAALAAVGNGARAPVAAPRRARRRRPGPRPGAPRAPRGQNRERILAVTAEKALEVPEIAQVTGIRRTVVATTVSILKRSGLMWREPGGYRSGPESAAARRARRGAARSTRRI